MPNPAKAYVCPKCTYETTLKKRMRIHLYNLKNPCTNETGVELTDEIKEYVLKHKRYTPPKSKPGSVNNIINNYNILNNFVVQMELSEKMDYLLKYQDRQLLDFEDKLENKFEKRVNYLECDKYKSGYYLSQDDLVGLINDVTKIDREHLEQFNILFDKTIKRFQIYRGKDWESFLEDIGARELVSLIKSYYLDTYELYLIRNLHSETKRTLNRFKLREHLDIYYSFIAVFDLTPSIIDLSDREVLKHRLMEDNEYYLGQTYMGIYQDRKNTLKISEKNRIKRKIINIVKENTAHNISEINQIVLDILKIDEEFRQQLIKTREVTEVDNSDLIQV